MRQYYSSQTNTTMKQFKNKLNHEFMKLFIVDKIAFQTASLHKKEQIVVQAKNKLDETILFFTTFTTFFLLMMAVKALIVL
jgi:hypothetical protein